MKLGPFSPTVPILRNPSVESFRYWEGLDWDRIAYQYAIVDPMDPYKVLYLTEREYNQLLRVALTMETTILVIARPGDEPPQDYEQKKQAKLNNKISPLASAPLLQDRYWRSALSQLIELKDTMVVIRPEKLEGIVTRYAKIVASYSGLALRPSLLKAVANFCYVSRKMIESEGINQYILRLKITKLALEIYLAGSKADTSALGLHLSVSKGGLPRWLPLHARQAFLNRSVPNIRFWLSILNIYRAVQGVYSDPDFSSIVEPRADIPFEDLSSWESFVRDFSKNFKLQGNLRQLKPQTFPILTSSSGVNPGQSILSAGAASWLWTFSKTNHLRKWLEFVQDRRGIKMFNFICLVNRPWASWYRRRMLNKIDLFLGRLHLKYEPAGKIRVFAMVDYWTQYALLPMHNTLFQLLSIFGKTDATFDQDLAVSSFSNVCPEYYSYDLKSATDMIPIQLYKIVLDVVFGKPTGDLWTNLLTDREFGLPVKDPKTHTYFSYDNKHYIKYGRGQPMGALSSWASLALIHHLLVQYAAYRITPGDKIVLFDKYRVLGDDIVIGCGEVAKEYLLICKEFSIPISLAKSVISPPSTKPGKKGWRLFQFANQIVLGPENISPLSLKEEVQANSLSSRLELVSKLVRRGWHTPFKIKILSFYLRALNPLRWRLGAPSLTKGRNPLFVEALLPILLSPMSKDVGLTGLCKYFAWYQSLIGSCNFANLLNHKFWLSDKVLIKHQHFIEFLSNRAEGLYNTIMTEQSWFGVEEKAEKLLSLSPISDYDSWVKYCDTFLEYPLIHNNADEVNRDILAGKDLGTDGLHLYWNDYKYSAQPLMKVERPTLSDNSNKPKKYKTIPLTYMNLPLVKEALQDYYKGVKKNLSPILTKPPILFGTPSFPLFALPGFISPGPAVLYEPPKVENGVFALLTEDEFRKTDFDQEWDGKSILYPGSDEPSSIPATYARLEDLLIFQKLFDTMTPEKILVRSLVENKPRYGFSHFVNKILSQNGKRIGARDLFKLKNKIVPSLPGV